MTEHLLVVDKTRRHLRLWETLIDIFHFKEMMQVN